MYRILDNISCDLGQDQIIYFNVNASSSTPFDAANSKFAGAQVNDIEDIGQHVV